MSTNVSSPNPAKVAWRVFRARRVRRPNPEGSDAFDHGALAPVLDAVARGGVPALDAVATDLDGYLASLRAIDPDRLDRTGALTFWMNLYNGYALRLVSDALDGGAASVLELARPFDDPVVTVAGERLTLNEVEHGKIRRFGDPRIHMALVCGSLSCPTLHPEPFAAARLDEQLETQARNFLAHGGARPDRKRGELHLSRVLLWYGGDFTRSGRMPTWLPAGKRRLLRVVHRWLDPDVAAWVAEQHPRLRFQPYDWGLGCSIG